MPLAAALRLSWLPKTSDGFFLRAESFFNFATYIDSESVPAFYGGTALHEQSHGQAFFAWFKYRFGVKRPSIYLLDEPEAALSPSRQMEFLRLLRSWELSGMAQFIIATHSPIIMSYPRATLLSFDSGSIREIAYTATDHYQITRNFLQDPERCLKALFAESDD
jgi:predicted ATPase